MAWNEKGRGGGLKKWWLDLQGKHIWTYQAHTTFIAPSPPPSFDASNMAAWCSNCSESNHTTKPDLLFQNRNVPTNFSLSALISCQSSRKWVMAFLFIVSHFFLIFSFLPRKWGEKHFLFWLKRNYVFKIFLAQFLYSKRNLEMFQWQVSGFVCASFWTNWKNVVVRH